MSRRQNKRNAVPYLRECPTSKTSSMASVNSLGGTSNGALSLEEKLAAELAAREQRLSWKIKNLIAR